MPWLKIDACMYANNIWLRKLRESFKRSWFMSLNLYKIIKLLEKLLCNTKKKSDTRHQTDRTKVCRGIVKLFPTPHPMFQPMQNFNTAISGFWNRLNGPTLCGLFQCRVEERKKEIKKWAEHQLLEYRHHSTTRSLYLKQILIY